MYSVLLGAIVFPGEVIVVMPIGSFLDLDIEEVRQVEDCFIIVL